MKEDHIQAGLKLLPVILLLKVNPFDYDFQERRNVYYSGVSATQF